MKKRFLLLTLSLILVLSTFVTGVACKKQGEEVEESRTVMIAGFESITDCTQNMIFRNDFGKLSITHDSKFVTEGSGAGKINAMGDTSGSPALEVVIPEENRDLSKLQAVTFDAYNDTDEEYTLNVYFRLSPAKGASSTYGPASGLKTQSKQVVLPSQKSVTVSPSFDISLLNVGYDMTSVYAIGLEFKKVGQKYEGKNDIYIDNLSITRYETEPEAIAVDLSENEICSFDKLWQKSVCYPSAYVQVSDYELTTSINTDKKYVKSGKSLKVEAPSAVDYMDAASWGWSYLKFPAKYVSAMNLTKYSKNDTLSLWVYKEGESSCSFYLSLWGENEELDKFIEKHIDLVDGWNHLTWSIAEINDGVDYLKDVTNIRLVFDYIKSDTTLYIDEFTVERGE